MLPPRISWDGALLRATSQTGVEYQQSKVDKFFELANEVQYDFCGAMSMGAEKEDLQAAGINYLIRSPDGANELLDLLDAPGLHIDGTTSEPPAIYTLAGASAQVAQKGAIKAKLLELGADENAKWYGKSAADLAAEARN